MKIYKGKIPFSASGELIETVRCYDFVNDWRDNYTFKAILVLVKVGNNTLTFDHKEGTYTMVLSKAEKLLCNHLCSGLVAGEWTFTKIGTRYSLRFLRAIFDEGELWEPVGD